MTHEQQIRMMMFQVARDYLANNHDVVKALPNYSFWYNRFTQSIGLLMEMTVEQGRNTNGISILKNDLKKRLGDMAFDLSSRMYAYAMQNELTAMKPDVYNPLSRFRFGTDSFVRDCSRKLYDLALEHMEKLSPYGVTAPMLEGLLAKLQLYEQALSKKRTKVSQMLAVTSRIGDVFDEANASLEQLDALMEMLHLSEPGFYAGYLGARKLVDTRTDPLAMQGQVLEDGTEQPVPNVTIELMRLPLNGHAPVTKQSARLGGFRVKSLEPGMYRVTASKLGYTEQTMEVAVNSGETTDVRIAMRKA